MVSLKDLPSPSTVYSAYASISASTMLLRTTINQVIPLQLQDFIVSTIRHCIFKNRNTSQLTLVIEEKDGMSQNEIYKASEIFTSTKIHPHINYLSISKSSKEDHLNIKFDKSETVVDSYQDVEITWRFVRQKLENDIIYDADDLEDFEADKRYFELSFDKKYKDFVLNCYVPYVLEKSKAIRGEKKLLKIHTLTSKRSCIWNSIKLEHPSTFDNIAMEPNLKKDIIEDLDSFVQRKEYYKRMGRAWKRGYLLYGPPGTGKSSLIAAIANYLKFDIYDLQLMNVKSDSTLRKLLLATCNKSILVIEDIDCSVELPDRNPQTSQKFTLSGLLNILDGLWTSCGDERITIFTTNNKERLDPALLRPGRMDMHIHMSYLSINGFNILASNYLGINIGKHSRYKEIKQLLDSSEVTPAEVAEELMKSSDVDLCIEELVNFLKVKKMDMIRNQTSNAADEIESAEIRAKRQKIDFSADI